MVPLELERASSASSVALDERGEATFVGIVLAVTILNLGLFVDLTEAHVGDHGADAANSTSRLSRLHRVSR